MARNHAVRKKTTSIPATGQKTLASKAAKVAKSHANPQAGEESLMSKVRKNKNQGNGSAVSATLMQRLRTAQRKEAKAKIDEFLKTLGGGGEDPWGRKPAPGEPVVVISDDGGLMVLDQVTDKKYRSPGPIEFWMHQAVFHLLGHDDQVHDLDDVTMPKVIHWLHTHAIDDRNGKLVLAPMTTGIVLFKATTAGLDLYDLNNPGMPIQTEFGTLYFEDELKFEYLSAFNVETVERLLRARIQNDAIRNHDLTDRLITSCFGQDDGPIIIHRTPVGQ